MLSGPKNYSTFKKKSKSAQKFKENIRSKKTVKT